MVALILKGEREYKTTQGAKGYVLNRNKSGAKGMQQSVP